MSTVKSQVPHYQKVYETLRKHIDSGVYNEGDILPSENELCMLHQITRPTVRKSLDMLSNEGYIKKRQGLGSVVQKKPKGIGILSIRGTTSAVGQENLKTRIVVKPLVRPWPEEFPFTLSDTEKESGCIYFERIRLVNNVPIFYDISYLPNINLPRFISRKLENHSLFNTLRQNYQIKVRGGDQRFKALLADDKIQQYLQTDQNTPILHLQRRLETNRIDFNIYSFLYCDTREHELFGSF